MEVSVRWDERILANLRYLNCAASINFYTDDEMIFRLERLAAEEPRRPEMRFMIEDPNEIDLPKRGKWVILDTVRGLGKVSLVSVEDVARSRNAGLTAHDYDLSTLLLLAKKLDPSFDPQILGVPEGIAEKVALRDVSRELSEICREGSDGK